MGSRQLCHDAAWAYSVSILECLENCLRPVERTDALHAVYQRVKAAIESYEWQMQREAARLRPSKN